MKKTFLIILGLLFVINIWTQENKVDKLEVTIKTLISQGVIAFNDVEESFNPIGINLEISPGYRIISTPSMDFGIVYGFIMIAGETSFSEARPQQGFADHVYNWEVSTITVGTLAKARYSFNFDINPLQVNLHNSIGLGFTFTNLDADGVYAEDNNIIEDKGETESSWTPMVDGGLRFTFPVGENSRLGLITDVLLAPFVAGDYENIITFGVGLNFQLNY